PRPPRGAGPAPLDRSQARGAQPHRHRAGRGRERLDVDRRPAHPQAEDRDGRAAGAALEAPADLQGAAPRGAQGGRQIEQLSQRMDADIKKALRALDTEYKVAKAREDSLLGSVNRLRAEGQQLNEKEIPYGALQREQDSNQQLYEAVLKRVKET